MLLNERNRNLIKQAVRYYGLDKRVNNMISSDYIKEAECDLSEELGTESHWKNYIDDKRLMLTSSKSNVCEVLIRIVSHAAEKKGIGNIEINRFKRRMRNFDCGLENLSTEQLVNIYKDLSVIKVVSKNPRNFYVWKLYQLLPNELKNEFLSNVFSLPIPQFDIAFVPKYNHKSEMSNNQYGNIEHTIQRNEIGKIDLILALTNDQFKEKEVGKQERYYLDLIFAELESELENNSFITYVMRVYTETTTADKVLLYFLSYLNLWKENEKRILGYALEIIKKFENNETHKEKDLKVLHSFYGVFCEFLEELIKPDYVPIPALDFKRDLDVKSLYEPSIEDLTEEEREELERFFENDDMANYLISQLNKASDEEEENNEDFDTNFDMTDIEEYAPYFTLIKYNEFYQRFLIANSVKQRIIEVDEIIE